MTKPEPKPGCNQDTPFKSHLVGLWWGLLGALYTLLQGLRLALIGASRQLMAYRHLPPLEKAGFLPSEQRLRILNFLLALLGGLRLRLARASHRWAGLAYQGLGGQGAPRPVLLTKLQAAMLPVILLLRRFIILPLERMLRLQVPSGQNDDYDQDMPFLSHLVELRARILRSLLALAAVLLLLLPFSKHIYAWMAIPLQRYLPEGSSMIAIQVASPFLIPFKLTLLAALVLALPFLLYQLWAFVAPGLYRHERRMIWPLLYSSVLLFFGGMAFCYFVVFPLMFGFLTSTAPEGVKVMTDITAYLDFILALLVAFGVAFQVPIATILLVATGTVEPKTLKEARPYVFIAVFIIGALLTPPDIVSQTLLSLPLWLLFEIGLFLSWFFQHRAQEFETADSLEEPRIAPPKNHFGPRIGGD